MPSVTLQTSLVFVLPEKPKAELQLTALVELDPIGFDSGCYYTVPLQASFPRSSLCYAVHSLLQAETFLRIRK